MRPLPNLSALSTGVCLGLLDAEPEQLPLPPVPTDNRGGRYFYLWHRPNDASFPRPERVKELVQRGGLVPFDCVAHPERVLSMRPADMSGLDPDIHEFLKARMNVQESHVDEKRSGVAWFYLNYRSGEEALKYASEDELIFRVPEAWLAYNALSCTELSPRSTEVNPIYAAWGLVTRLKVPLDYRITSPHPLRDEGGRAMSNKEVTDLLYYAHLAEDPKSREPYTPAPPPPPQVDDSDDSDGEIVNPFADNFMPPRRPLQPARRGDAAPCPALDPPPGGRAEWPCTRETAR